MGNLYPIITIILAMAISICYLIYIRIYITDKTWDTTTNYVTTVLSIVVGAMISIIIYNIQQEDQSQQKLKELRKNLAAELSDINRGLISGDVMTVNEMSFLVTYIEPIIIKECAKSGLFQPKEVENLLHISRKTEFYNVQVNYFLAVIANANNPHFQDILTNCNKNMETTRSAIVQSIQLIVNQFNLTLSDSIYYE